MKLCACLIVLVATFGIPRAAFACSCDPAPVANALKAADIAFSGVVTSVRLAQQVLSEGEAPTIVESRMLRSWKNATANTVTLYTQRNLSTCEGYEFIVGERYVVFARRNSSKQASRYAVGPTAVTPGVGLCTGTSSFRMPATRERERQLLRLTSQQRSSRGTGGLTAAAPVGGRATATVFRNDVVRPPQVSRSALGALYG
jgi:hypothetical protein